MRIARKLRRSMGHRPVLAFRAGGSAEWVERPTPNSRKTTTLKVGGGMGNWNLLKRAKLSIALLDSEADDERVDLFNRVDRSHHVHSLVSRTSLIEGWAHDRFSFR
jgi:hypothetical protein